jgi:hypothetical protein
MHDPQVECAAEADSHRLWIVQPQRDTRLRVQRLLMLHMKFRANWLEGGCRATLVLRRLHRGRKASAETEGR